MRCAYNPCTMEELGAPDAWVLTLHVGWVLLAAFGGLARYLDRYVRKGEVPVWPVMGAHMLVSGFGGYMVASMVNLIEPRWVWIGAGIGGYMGTEALDWLSRVLQKRYGGDAPMMSTQKPKSPTTIISKKDDEPQ